MPQIPPFLGEFSDEDVKWLIAVGDKVHVAAGEAIIVEGKPLADIFFVLEGTFRLSSSKYPVPQLELGVGELLGEMSYVQKQPPLATVTAVEDAVVLCVDRSHLNRRLGDDAGFDLRFNRVLAAFTVSRLYGQWTSGALGFAEPGPAAEPPPEPDAGPPSDPDPPPAPAPKPPAGPPSPPGAGDGLYGSGSPAAADPTRRVWEMIRIMLEEGSLPPTGSRPGEGDLPPEKPDSPGPGGGDPPLEKPKRPRRGGSGPPPKKGK